MRWVPDFENPPRKRTWQQRKGGNFWWGLDQVSLNFSDSSANVDNVDFSLWWFARPVLWHAANFSSCALVLTVIKS